MCQQKIVISESPKNRDTRHSAVLCRHHIHVAKNTAQGRGAIRAQTIVELEKKKDAQIIEDYGEVTVTASADDPTVCLVEFSFAVAHGLNQIHLAVHLTV